MPISNDPHPIDIHVGARVRTRRKNMDMSQDELGTHLGLSFQQVQKYERGSNRISASKLYDMGKALKVPVEYFFEGYEEGGAAGQFTNLTSEAETKRFLQTEEGAVLAEAFPQIRGLKRRRRILELVRSLTEDQ